MNILVNAYAALSDYRQAAALHMEVLGLRQRVMGADHQTSPYTSINKLISALSDYRQAAALHVEDLALYKGMMGADHPDTAI